MPSTLRGYPALSMALSNSHLHPHHSHDWSQAALECRIDVKHGSPEVSWGPREAVQFPTQLTSTALRLEPIFLRGANSITKTRPFSRYPLNDHWNSDKTQDWPVPVQSSTRIESHRLSLQIRTQDPLEDNNLGGKWARWSWLVISTLRLTENRRCEIPIILL